MKINIISISSLPAQTQNPLSGHFLVTFMGGLIITVHTKASLFPPPSSCTYNSHINRNGSFLAHFMCTFNSCVVQKVSNCQPWVSVIPPAYLHRSTAIRRDIRHFLICELPHRSVECVLLHSLNAQHYIFAVVNCSDAELSVFYSPVLTRCRIFLQLRTALS